jgi:molybdate transport system substrate-binding protein
VNVTSLEDLRNARRLVIGTEYVPVGRYTREVLRRASRAFGAAFEGEVLGRVVSEENNVRLVRAKVELGEADAAIVYASDVRTGSGVRVIPIPEAVNVRADYCIAAIDGTTNAAPFIAFLGSPAGEAILERHGFEVDRAAP